MAGTARKLCAWGPDDNELWDQDDLVATKREIIASSPWLRRAKRMAIPDPLR